MKLCLCQYTVRPVQINDDYNHPGSVHISGHMGPLRMIPIAAGSYQGHVPYQTLNHGPVYNVQHAPVAVHPMPVAPVVGNYHVEEPAASPVYKEPVAVHHVEPVIHPDDVQEYVEEVEGQSADRHGRNNALNIDMVPIELSVPMLSQSTREPVRKQPKRKLRNHEETDSKRNPRFSGSNFDINVDIKDIQFNSYSSVDANVPSKFLKIESGVDSIIQNLENLGGHNFDINVDIEDVQYNRQIDTYSGVDANLPSKFRKIESRRGSVRRNNHSGLSSLPKSTKLRRKNHSDLRSLPKSSKLRRKNHSGWSSLPKSSKLRRKNHSDLSSLPKSSKLRRKNHSDLRSLPKSSKLRRKNHSGWSSLPKSSKSRRKNHSDLSGLRNVPHEWVNKDEKRYSRQSFSPTEPIRIP